MEPLPRSKHTKREIILLLILFLTVIAVGMTFYHNVENLDLVDSFYLTSATLTTVGYGDVTPKTDVGKVFTGFYAFVGIGMFLGVAGVIFHNAIAYSRKHQQNSPKKSEN